MCLRLCLFCIMFYFSFVEGNISVSQSNERHIHFECAWPMKMCESSLIMHLVEPCFRLDILLVWTDWERERTKIMKKHVLNVSVNSSSPIFNVDCDFSFCRVYQCVYYHLLLLLLLFLSTLCHFEWLRGCDIVIVWFQFTFSQTVFHIIAFLLLLLSMLYCGFFDYAAIFT